MVVMVELVIVIVQITVIDVGVPMDSVAEHSH